jgi:hypothetical protein
VSPIGVRCIALQAYDVAVSSVAKEQKRQQVVAHMSSEQEVVAYVLVAVFSELLSKFRRRE